MAGEDDDVCRVVGEKLAAEMLKVRLFYVTFLCVPAMCESELKQFWYMS